MKNRVAVIRGARGLLLAAGLASGLGSTAGCGDDADVPAATAKGGTSAGGEGGAGPTAGKAAADGGSGEGGEATCDCGDDVDAATIPLDCACAAGLCTDFEDDLVRYRNADRFGLPYYVLLGTCAAGYRTLSYGEATEQSGLRTFDASGHMVYDEFGGYDGFVPDACGFDGHFSLGQVTIGTNPATDCDYCLLAGDDEQGNGGAAGNAGAGGTSSGEPFYAESKAPPCASSDLK